MICPSHSRSHYFLRNSAFTAAYETNLFLSVISSNWGCISNMRTLLFAGTPKVQAIVTDNVGVIDAPEIQLSTSIQSKRQKSYVKWTDKQRFDIGKYAAENCNANAVRKFKGEFATLTKSTVRTFKKKYYQELTAAAKEQSQPSQSYRGTLNRLVDYDSWGKLMKWCKCT